ncbi:hypothetical protein MTO96_042189, partial [Rhipicephalus appendiculatus]
SRHKEVRRELVRKEEELLLETEPHLLHTSVFQGRPPPPQIPLRPYGPGGAPNPAGAAGQGFLDGLNRALQRLHFGRPG